MESWYSEFYFAKAVRRNALVLLAVRLGLRKAGFDFFCTLFRVILGMSWKNDFPLFAAALRFAVLDFTGVKPYAARRCLALYFLFSLLKRKKEAKKEKKARFARWRISKRESGI
ncbi:hypothetical protein [Ruminococcus sp.]|uniref:hypothetical protein n=1 Tax=Ruminococcus sp. TaxID=41978 RepID=UPI0025F62BB9|nr:hypothetical protein [Ruminococcus sp.]